MTETGWPLIPREVLPAPVPAAKTRPLPRPEPPDAGRQLSIFGAETTEPSPADLAGVLFGPGRLGRMGGTARVSIPVEAAWRVHVLVAELVGRGLVVSWLPLDQDQDQLQDLVRDEPVNDERNVVAPPPLDDVFPPDDFDLPPEDYEPAEPVESTGSVESAGPIGPPESLPSGAPSPLAVSVVPDKTDTPVDSPQTDEVEKTDEPDTVLSFRPHFEVRTAYSSRLDALARAWPDAAAQLFLSGPRLRLWVAAAGEPIPGGYALGLNPDADPEMIDAALVRAGLAGQLSDDGRHYLIKGRRRLTRLAELVGERPATAPEHLWPGGAAA